MNSLLQSLMVGFFLPFLVFLYYLRKWRQKNPSTDTSTTRVAPEAAGAWPIIGHLHLLGKNSVPHITLGAMADKYGPAFTIRLGMHYALVVSSWEVAKECFTINDRALATRPKSIAIKYMGYNYAIFGFSHYGSYWREVRKIATLELLSNHRLEMFKHVRISEVETSIRELYEMWAEKNSSACTVWVDMKKWLADLALNIIVRMVAGKRYFGNDTACNMEERLLCQEGIRDCLHYFGIFIMSDNLPFLEGLDVQGYEKHMKRSAKNMDFILQGWLDEHRRERSSTSSNKMRTEQDFMDVMISSMEDSKFDYDADTVIKATCLNIIIGANDTTLVTLTWALSLLLNNRHVLKKAQEELGMHISKDRKVDESDIIKLEYLQAIVKETLRLYPAAPLSGPHEAMEECTIAGYRVTAGTRIVTNLWKIHRDPCI
ncbi:demethylepipodophyllotoxin synthase-like [Telopea speciosissima]|uniref:demethylepipodophyllotoxin synthase-like n=1 Tax=Telopea speciosissima TaxID=54955 RepID=UPI001CC82014|nr:demethylepipodophyllotoxin synthase-like [Telopea speciosissima]